MVSFMKLAKKKKLLIKFLAFFLPMLIASIMLTGFVLSITSYRFFRKTIDQDYRNIIRASAGEIQLFMDNARRSLEALALLMKAAKLDDWQQKMALIAFIHSHPQFEYVTLYSTDGKTMATSLFEDPETGVAAEEPFISAAAGKAAISGVMAGEENIPFIYMAAPVSRLGKTAGVLWAQLNLKAVWDVLEGISIGKTGHVYIMDLSGRYIGHRQIDHVIRRPPADKSGILEEIHAAHGPVEWTENQSGRAVYNLGAHVPALDWVVVLSQPRSEIFAYLYQNFWWAAGITFLISALAICLGWRWTRRIIDPIQRLHTQVVSIGAGDLEHKVSVDTEDEIGELGKAFNDMTDSLKTHIRREIETAKALAHARNLAVLGTASSKVTHEVGNFLSNTDMALGILKRESVSDRGKRIIAVLENDATRVKEFIQSFLGFAKKPELILKNRPLDLIIREVVDVFQAESEKRNIPIRFHWEKAIPMIPVDAGMVHQAMANLIKNAMEAVDHDGEIVVEGKSDAGRITLTVADSGPGMTPEIRDQVFEPFFTTKGKQGTGLGMPIVKSIVEAHRGVIECRSAPDRGTVFTIYLPLG